MHQLSKLVLLLVFICLYNTGFSQQKITITGTVVSATSGKPIAFTSIAVLDNAEQQLIAGANTDDDGKFSLEANATDVFIVISSIGFDRKEIRNLNIQQDKVSLGNIELTPNEHTLDEVSVVDQKSTIQFKLDKRVFNVGSDLSTAGLGAMELLNKVPSVNVDIEGQISLRGNTGVQVLINGKPSVLADDGSKALSTLTADMIDRIEVITSPSAKYEAEGSSGIINIVLKKEEKKGVNGSVSVNTGAPHNHSIGISLNKRTEHFNFFTQFGAGYRTRPSYENNTNNNLASGRVIESNGENKRNENFYNIILGTDYYINDYNVVTLSGNFAYEIEDQPSDIHFDIYNDGVLTEQYSRLGKTTANNPKYQYDIQYKKQFRNNKEHTLLLNAMGNFFGKKQNSEFTNVETIGNSVDEGQKNSTDFYQANYNFSLDYTNPITQKVSLEAGALYEISDVGNDFSVHNLNNNEWVLQTNQTNNFKYKQNVLGVYGTAAYEGEKWGVKGGLRVENTDLKTLLVNTNEQNNYNYTNLFPSFHTSYKVNKRVSMQLGYSRRIARPRLWDLNPFFTIQNAYNIRKGNPDLLPEFAHSFEFTSIFIFENFSFNSSIYHLYTIDIQERVSYFENDVNITTPENIGTRNQTGLELNGKYTLAKWMVITGDANYGYFLRKGSFNNQSFDFSGNQFTSKLTSRIKLPADIEAEISGNYQSKYKTVQGTTSGFVFADIGVRKRFYKGKAVLNIAVQDIFASRIREHIINQPDFYLNSFSKRGRFIVLGFSYSFGKGEAMSYTGSRH